MQLAKRSGIMLCHPLDERKLAKWQPPYICQPKLDGERCRSVDVVEGTKLPWPVMLSSSEAIFRQIPHIQKALNDFHLHNPGIELDGELYAHGLSFEEIHSRCASSRITTHANIAEIEFHVFDIVDESKNQMERLVALNNLYFVWPIVRVPFALINSLDEGMKMLDRYLTMGYEGIILRHCENIYQRSRSQLLMKFKPAKEDIYEIIGWKEETDKYGNFKETIGALVCRGETGNIFSCGSGLTDEISAKLWEEKATLIGRKLRVKYQHLTPGKQVPRFPVFVEVI